MKELEKFSEEQLRDELYRRKKIIAIQIPETTLEGNSGFVFDSRYFYVHVNDGCEGFGFLVEVPNNLDPDRNINEDDIRDYIKRHVYLNPKNSDWIYEYLDPNDSSMLTFEVQELGPYALNKVVITKYTAP